MDSFIAKPIEVERLFAIIEEVLERQLAPLPLASAG
jgi:hypothetical protein